MFVVLFVRKSFSYYLGIPDSNPSRQHLYRVSSLPPKFGENLKHPQCLTCSQLELAKKSSATNAPPRLVTDWDDNWEEDPTFRPFTTAMPKRRRNRKEFVQKREPIPCQYHDATFAAGHSSFVLIECLGPDVPYSAIYRIPLEFHNQKPMMPLFFIQNNTLLRERIASIAMPQVKSFPVMISGGYHAQVRLFLPPGLREDEITRYPLILHV